VLSFGMESVRGLPPQVTEALRRILAVSRPELVILFDSWARGEAGPDSDVDLLVVCSMQPEAAKEARAW
jgi:predicted nucleotidyltransferase